jgi:hypothetical protein
MPEAFYAFTHLDWVDFESMEVVIQAYWSMTDAYVFGEGYRQLDWLPDKPIEHWLTEHILSYLMKVFPNEYLPFLGPIPIAEDGSICRMPMGAERAHW